MFQLILRIQPPHGPALPGRTNADHLSDFRHDFDRLACRTDEGPKVAFYLRSLLRRDEVLQRDTYSEALEQRIINPWARASS
jgi:hypothetical protein